MATISAVIKKSNGSPLINKAGQSIVYIQYIHDSKRAMFASPVKINPVSWNDKREIVDTTKELKKIVANDDLKDSIIKEDQRTNATIGLYKSRVNSILRGLQNAEENPTIEKVKSEYFKLYQKVKEEEKDFLQLMDEYITQEAKKSEATIKQIRSTYNNLKTFETLKKEKITLAKIDLKLYDRLIKYFLKEHVLPTVKDEEQRIGMTNDSVGTQIKNIKAFLSYLKRRGYEVSADLSQWKVYKEKLTIIYLTQEELSALYKYDFSENKRLERVRDLFVLQCRTGLRVSDLLRLGKEHIHGDVIKLVAHKNKKPVLVPILDETAAILKKYNYVLPVITEQKLNEYIKEACNVARIRDKVQVVEYRGGEKIYTDYFKYELISSHIAVKTFCTHCAEKNIPAKMVADITGKTVAIINSHYYGTNERTIVNTMQKAFGSMEPQLKIA